MVRIGLLGCGRWGRHILRDLKGLGVWVAVLARSPGSRANAVAGGADAIAAELEHLPEVDGYVVAVPTVLHARFVERLIGSAKPIFCEKPLTNDVEAAQRIASSAGESVFVMDKWRYHGGVRALKAIAESGELGPVLGIKTVRVGWGNPHDDVDVDWILLPHDLSITLEILGFVPKARAAWAERGDDGLIALSGWLESDSVWVHFEVGARSPVHRRTIELRCRDGVASLGDAYDESVSVLRTRGCLAGEEAPKVELRAVGQEMPLLKELAAFVGHVRGDGPPPVSSAAEGALIVERIAELRRLAGLEG